MPIETPLSLRVINPGLTVPPGVQLPCYGPYYMPVGARSLRKFQPKVNMEIVHHMIMFGGRGQGRGNTPGNTHLCYQVARSPHAPVWRCGTARARPLHSLP